jgi:hypothetical protein
MRGDDHTPHQPLSAMGLGAGHRVTVMMEREAEGGGGGGGGDVYMQAGGPGDRNGPRIPVGENNTARELDMSMTKKGRQRGPNRQPYSTCASGRGRYPAGPRRQ